MTCCKKRCNCLINHPHDLFRSRCILKFAIAVILRTIRAIHFRFRTEELPSADSEFFLGGMKKKIHKATNQILVENHIVMIMYNFAGCSRDFPPFEMEHSWKGLQTGEQLFFCPNTGVLPFHFQVFFLIVFLQIVFKQEQMEECESRKYRCLLLFQG